MRSSSRMLHGAALKVLGKMRYFSASAAALVEVGGQLLRAGGNDEKFGEAVCEGVITGLGAELGQKFPRCPFCGRRHEPASPALVRTAVARAMGRLFR